MAVIQKVFDRLSVAFAGAVLGFLVAEYGFGAEGLDKPESFAYGGLVLTLGALGMVKTMRAPSVTQG